MTITTTDALELAGKAEITRLHTVIEGAYDAIVDGRKGDAIKLLRTEINNHKIISRPPSATGTNIA